jgi:pimeloyl-ACP methyl ester carboxylesterase
VRPQSWLLLRGLAREQRHWGDVPDLLAAGLDAPVVRLDLPGTGTENGRPSPTTIRGIAEDLRERWLAIRGEGRWGIIAPSLAGMVAMRWMADHPDDFAAAVLINTSTREVGLPWERMQLHTFARILRAVLDSDPIRREERVLAATTRLVADPAARARRWSELAAERPLTRTNFVRQLLAAARFSAPESLVPPVLVVVGEGDQLCAPKCPKALAARFGASIAIHPRAGHDLGLDDPQWLVEQIGGWLA